MGSLLQKLFQKNSWKKHHMGDMLKEYLNLPLKLIIMKFIVSLNLGKK
jgi:hypothetical protein